MLKVKDGKTLSQKKPRITILIYKSRLKGKKKKSITVHVDKRCNPSKNII